MFASLFAGPFPSALPKTEGAIVSQGSAKRLEGRN
jgi:hypothetical protein